MFASWGRIVHRFRWIVLIASILMLPVSVVLMKGFGGHFAHGQSGSSMEAQRAMKLIEKQIGTSPVSFTAIFSSTTQSASDPAFKSAVLEALAPIRHDSHITGVQTAYDTADVNPQYISKDGHGTIAVISLKGKFMKLIDVYPSLARQIHSSSLHVQLAGELPQYQDNQKIMSKDLSRALSISTPLLIVLLLFVFGALVAAGLPLGVGILAVITGTSATLLLARFTDVMSAASEIVIMVGLGVAVDYSLFILNRFREELRQRETAEALAVTMATAGRAILFSGVTVSIGLLGLTFFHLGAIGSVGVAGTFAVALAVTFSLTFLASLLAILGPRVNKLRMPFIHPDRHTPGRGFWHGLSRRVMARPWQVLIPTVVILLSFAIPVVHMRLGWSDYTSFPKSAPSRQAQELLTRQYPGGDTNLSIVVVNFGQDGPLTPAHIRQTYQLSQWLRTLPGVSRVDSLYSAPGRTVADYQNLLTGSAKQLPRAVRAAKERFIGTHIATLNVYTANRAASDAARDLVKTIRAEHPAIGGSVMVTGATAADIDGIKVMMDDAPLAIGFVMIATYLVLFLLLGSVLLPLKAVLMNLLSVTASYGALVFIFQDGHFADALGFTPNPIDISLPIVMFCILFGLSMDYEVILLSRFKEIYERTGDNTEAVAQGLERTGKLVTGAALIMATVFFAYGSADDAYIKAFGIGLGTAVVVDAAIIRTLLVPAAMRLMGVWNWWAPAPLARLHARLALGERSAEEPALTTAPAQAAQ